MGWLSDMDQMPWSVLDRVFSYLDAASLSRVGAANLSLYEAVNSDSLWRRHVCQRKWDRFGPGGLSELYPHWEIWGDEGDPTLQTRTPISASSPLFRLDRLLLRRGSKSRLPECCRWRQVFLRAAHLDANWRQGRYTVCDRLRGHTGQTNVITDLCCDGQSALSAGKDGVVCVWQLRRGADDDEADWGATPVRRVARMEFHCPVVSLAMSPAHIAVALDDGTVHIYSRPNLSVAARVYRPFPASAEVSQVCLAPDCAMLAVVSEPMRHPANPDATTVAVHIWDLGMDAPAAQVNAVHCNEATWAAVDGALLVTASWDSSVAVLDLSRGVEAARLADVHHGDGVICLRSRHRSPTPFLVTGGADGHLACWEYRCSGRGDEPGLSVDLVPLWDNAAVGASGGEVYCVDFNDRVVVSGGSDSVVRVWSLEGEALAEMAGHSGIVRHLALMDNGRLVSAGDIKMVFVWDLTEVGAGPPPAPVRLHRNQTLVGHIWVSDTLILISSSNHPPELTALAFW